MDKLKIGRKIRRLRFQNGLTLQKVAERTGLTKSYLSMLELGKKSPAIATLSKIAQALSVDIAAFFEQKRSEDKIVVTPKGEGEVVARDRTVFGYRYEAIAPTKRMKKMEPFIVTFPINNLNNVGDVIHEGEELMYILEGKVNFYYGGKKYSLAEGDCIYLDSGIPHRSERVGKKPAKSLTVIYTPPWKEAV
jgi:transcriptional regulator with XRE-family HTH domain